VITLAERRRVGRFADLIDGADDAQAGELAPLLTLGRTMQRVPVSDDIDPAFRAKLRARVVAMAAVRLPVQRETSEPTTAPAPTRVPRSRRAQRLVVGGGLMACVLSLAGVCVASMDAVVGDPLYGIKRATESTQLKLAGSDTDRGRRYLTLARTRLGEARQVRGDQNAMVDTLAAMDLATRQGTRLLTAVAASEQDRAPLDSLDEFVVVQRTGLGSLISSVAPGPARERAVESLVLVEQLKVRSVALRITMVCPAAAAPADDLGPRPVDCAAASSAAPSTGPLPPGLNGLPGPTPGDLGGTALPPITPAPPGGEGSAAPPVGSDATGAVSDIVEELLGSLGGNPTSAPPARGTAPPPSLPLPSITPTLPPLPGPR